jgi:NADP-dependent 3-hydroxy acid dehydrogenase YdfG
VPPIRDQAVVVTGATGDMGRAIAEMLAREGARLAVSGRDGRKLVELESHLRELGAACVSGVVDVTVEDAVCDFFARAKAVLGPLDVLIHTPGLSIPGSIPAMALTDFQQMLDVNVKGAFLAAKHFAAQVDEAAGGLLINLGSMAARRANPNAPIYCATKAALAMMDEGLALQLAAKNVRVTTIHPGAADTQFWGTRQVPREKFLKVDEIAEVIRFILGVPKRVVIHEIAFESFEFFRGK